MPLTSPFPPVLVTAAIQILLWRDRRTASRAEPEDSLPASSQVSDIPHLEASDVKGEKTDRVDEAKLETLG